MSPKEPDDVLEILTKIETLDDLEENKKIIVDLVLGEFKVFVDAMKSLTDGSMSPEEIETKITSIEGGREKLEQEMEKELDRISKIPGAEDVVLSLKGELTGQMGALAQKMAQLMMQLMGNVMGGMFGAEDMGDEMGQTMTGFNFTEEDMEGYEPPEGETFEVLEFVRLIKPTDNQKEKAEELVNILEEFYKQELQTAKGLKDTDLSPEELREKVIDLQKRQMYVMSEMQQELERLDTSDDSEYGEAIEDQLTARVEPIMDELFQVIEELGLQYMMAQDQGQPSEPREEVWCPECEHAIDEEDNNHCTYCGLHLEDYYEGRVKLDSLYTLYEVRTLDGFIDNKDNIIGSVEDGLQNDIYELELLDSPDWINDNQENVEDIEKRLKSLDKELEVHLTRLKALPDAAKDVEAFEKELKAKIEAKIKEINVHLERIKKEASWHNG